MFPQEIFAAASPVEIFLKVSASATLPPSVIHILSNSYIHKSKGGLSGMVGWWDGGSETQRGSLHLFCCVQHLVRGKVLRKSQCAFSSWNDSDLCGE